MEVQEAERARAGGDGDGGVDRLSSLPDCLLHTIMSSLKARQVVRTSVLSKRWRHLWRSVPCLDVDQDEFGAVPPERSNNNSQPAPVVDNDFSDDDDDIEDVDDDAKDNEWDNFDDFADA